MKKIYEFPEIYITKITNCEYVMLSGITTAQDDLDELDVDFS